MKKNSIIFSVLIINTDLFDTITLKINNNYLHIPVITFFFYLRKIKLRLKENLSVQQSEIDLRVYI